MNNDYLPEKLFYGQRKQKINMYSFYRYTTIKINTRIVDLLYLDAPVHRLIVATLMKLLKPFHLLGYHAV